MKTKTQRVVSLGLVVCLAVAMMLSMSACGKKTLEDYMNSSAMQTTVSAMTKQYEDQGMTCSMYAEGDDLRMDITMTSIEATAEEAAQYKEVLDPLLEENSATFVDMANEVKKACSNETINVVVTYLDNAGTELTSMSFAADS